MSDFYANVPAAQVAALRQFRQQFPPRTIRVDGSPWEVIDTATSGPPLLILVGGLRVADASFKTSGPLAENFRVIVPSYPPLSTMNALCDGLAGVLDELMVDKVHVLAGSFGGMLAQVLVRRYAQRVNNLVLSSTGIPSAAGYRQQRQQVAMLPRFLLKRLLASRFLRIMAVSDEQQAFWRAYLRELFFVRLGKADALATFDAIIDFASTHTFSRGDLQDWAGDLLIIQSSDDATFDETARAEVRNLYPRARFHLFTDAGHSPSMNKPLEYRAVIREFFGQ